MTSPSTFDNRALIIVDVQNDFTEGGPTPVAGGDAVAFRIGAYLQRERQRYAVVVTTQDWHIEPGDEHFAKHAVHCLAGSDGAALDPELSRGAGREITDLVDVQVRKGQYAADYSGFRAVDDGGTLLPDLLQERAIAAVDVCGLAENACVAATIRDAIDAGLEVRLFTDLSGATSVEAANEVEEELAAQGALVLESSEGW